MSRAVTRPSEQAPSAPALDALAARGRRRLRVPAVLRGLGMATVTVAIGLALAGCGVRGSLDAPPDAKAEPEKAKAEAGKGPEVKPEHKGFVLDGLIR